MVRFKPGDIVRCVMAKSGVLERDRTYTIERDSLDGIRLNGYPGYCFLTSRFVLDETHIIDKVLTKYQDAEV